jgi:lipopolysaccharide transport system ATP-binding protein
VAIHSEPESLIVDETLSVGDEAFQRKCFARIHDLRQRGTSILFVSHAAAAIVELCDRALLLDQGELILTGRPKEVVALYQKLIYSPADRAAAVRRAILEGGHAAAPAVPPAPDAAVAPIAGTEDAEFDPRLVPQSTVAYESRGAEIEDPHLETHDGRRVNVLVHGDEYVFTYHVRFAEAAGTVTFGMLIKTIAGVRLGGGTSAPPNEAIPHVAAGSHFRVAFRFRCLLNADAYFLNAGVLGATEDGLGHLDRRLDVAMFRVKVPPRTVATGAVDFDIVPSVDSVS